MRALMIEPDSLNRDFVSMLLEMELEADIVGVSTVKEAVDLFSTDSDFNFVISEYDTPEGGADIFYRLIREERKEFKHLPFILVTKNDKNNCGGFVNALTTDPSLAFFRKPLKDADFFKRLNVMLENAQKLAPKEEQEEVVADWSVDKKKAGTKEEVKADWSTKKEKEEKKPGKERTDSSSEEDDAKSTRTSLSGVEETSDKARGKMFDKEDEDDNKPKRVLGEKSNKKPKPKPEGDYIPVNIHRMKNLPAIACDGYLKVARKFLIVFRKNDEHFHEVIIRYLGRGVEYLYIHKDQYTDFSNSFSKLIEANLTKMMGNPEAATMAQLVSFSHLHERVSNLDMTEEALDLAKQTVEGVIDTFEKESDRLQELISKVMKNNDYITEHSLITSYVCTELSQLMDWKLDDVPRKLAMAALLHDANLGDAQLARVQEIDEFYEKELTYDDIKKIKNHPISMAQEVGTFKNFISDVDNIIIQHHERPDGSGFPRGLNSSQISPLTCVFILAEELADLICNNQYEEDRYEGLKSYFNEKYCRGNFRAPLETFLNRFFTL